MANNECSVREVDFKEEEEEEAENDDTAENAFLLDKDTDNLVDSYGSVRFPSLKPPLGRERRSRSSSGSTTWNDSGTHSSGSGPYNRNLLSQSQQENYQNVNQIVRSESNFETAVFYASPEVGNRKELLARAMSELKQKLRNLYGTAGTWMKRLPWFPDYCPVETYYVKQTISLLDRAGRKRYKRLQTLEDILRSPGSRGTQPRTILIIGAAGSGKSTLLKKLAYLWANDDSELFSSFTVLLVFSLAVIKESGNLVNVITDKLRSYYHKRCGLSIDTWLEEAKMRSLILLDGFDEMDELGKENIRTFLKHDSPFFSSTVAVTTRYLPQGEIKTLFMRFIRIECLEEPSVDQVIKNSIDTNDGADLEGKVRKFLKQRKDLKFVQGTPLILYSLCYVFSSVGNEHDFSSCELWYNVVIKLLKGKAEERNVMLSDEQINLILNRLGELSKQWLLRNELFFAKSQLSAVIPDIMMNIVLESGLFQPLGPSVNSADGRGTLETKSRQEVEMKYEILHKVFMEALAVRWCNEQIRQRDSPEEKVRLLTPFASQTRFPTTGRVLVDTDLQTYLSTRFAGGLDFYVKQGDTFTDGFFETTDDSDSKKRISSFEINLEENKTVTRLEENESLDLLSHFTSTKMVKKSRIVLENTLYCFMATFMVSDAFHIVGKNNKILVMYTVRFCIFALLLLTALIFKITRFSQDVFERRTLLRNHKRCVGVILTSSFIAACPYLSISVVFYAVYLAVRNKYEIPKPEHDWLDITRKSGNDWLIFSTTVFFSSLFTCQFALPVAAMCYQKYKDFFTESVTTTAAIIEIFGFHLIINFLGMTLFSFIYDLLFLYFADSFTADWIGKIAGFHVVPAVAICTVNYAILKLVRRGQNSRGTVHVVHD